MFITNFKLKSHIQRYLCDFNIAYQYPISHPVNELKRRALHETADYITTSMQTAAGVKTAKEVIDIALSEASKEGKFLEFGVYRGGTIRYIARKIFPELIHGFDSFEGLPEKWSGGLGLPKGAFFNKGKPPKVPSNVCLYKGWFSDTLPRWLTNNISPISFLHIDCDLYSSTKCIFDNLKNYIIPGTVIVFDEYYNYHGWKNHEFKAFQEFVTSHNVQYEYLAYSHFQVAIRIKDYAEKIK